MRYVYGLTSALLLGGATFSLVSGFPAGAQVAQNDAQKMSAVVPRAGAPASFADLTAQLQPAVVNISTRQKVKVQNENPLAGTPFEGMFGGQSDGGGSGGQTREAQSLGSGFIVSADGYVVTNNHVITAEGQGEVESISVTLSDGNEYPAKLIGKDAQSDLAVLKITTPKPLPFVKFGDSGAARVGDWVIAIGNPFGLGGTVTAGIVSAVLRNTGSGGAYDRYIQTDAAINQGNSGGPMFDMKGQVIGINRAILSPTGGSVGIGLAIPSDIASPIVDKLIHGKTIARGYLGVRIQPLNDDLADSLGVPHNKGEFIQGVEPGKAAAVGGMLAGDVVLRVNGQEVSPRQSLSYLVANTAPGTRIPIDIIRNGKPMTLQVTVATRPSEEELAQQTFDPDNAGGDNPFKKGANPKAPASSGLTEKAIGLSVQPLTPPIARAVGVAESTKGVVIGFVDPNSDAGSKGLSRGDVVISAGYQPVNTVAELEAAIRAAQASNRPALLLQVIHRGQPAQYVPIRLR
ncbi:Do family serine endopeptidase [Novosphingobium rosa]|uniref:Do family serine endopeptidase n=1 Tax=Novosphingobium rosa TaxID=76978 RepID=UPI000B11A990|nr:Do family serine endopeptidase [Novosphingobium rosa]